MSRHTCIRAEPPNRTCDACVEESRATAARPREAIQADIAAMIRLMREDQRDGPYVMVTSLAIVRAVNPELAAELEAVGPDVPVEIILDVDGHPCGWRRL